MRIGVVQFPGSNDERDAAWALQQLGADAELLWHGEADLRGVDAVVLPGGFSYGDYLRCGAIARFSPVMTKVVPFATDGGLVLGICNGFQVLCEAGLLPGALVRNAGLAFVCDAVDVVVEDVESSFLARAEIGDVLTIPIKHGEGRYVADPATLEQIEADGRIVVRYCMPDGSVTPEANPNGATGNIAGVRNEAGNVFGMMPHPEHAVDAEVGIGSADGAVILGSLIDALVGAEA
ncbi:MAG: phosphoribosylformylglycinamidine synthase subunit PurQ [Actinobacteria bacterium]|nr:MAG: phosphoribosylformylglycinamidine synthase subunit PurQ [Actinomycetota bacterium]